MIQQLDVQDGWKVEFRQRRAGKRIGDLYYVFICPQGRMLYTGCLVIAIHILYSGIVV